MVCWVTIFCEGYEFHTFLGSDKQEYNRLRGPIKAVTPARKSFAVPLACNPKSSLHLLCYPVMLVHVCLSNTAHFPTIRPTQTPHVSTTQLTSQLLHQFIGQQTVKSLRSAIWPPSVCHFLSRYEQKVCPSQMCDPYSMCLPYKYQSCATSKCATPKCSILLNVTSFGLLILSVQPQKVSGVLPPTNPPMPLTHMPQLGQASSQMNHHLTTVPLTGPTSGKSRFSDFCFWLHGLE